VRQLEDALRNEQALTAEEPHPVLAGGDFHVSGLRGHLAPSSVKDDLGLDVVADAMGTLLIAEDGSQRYFGRSSGPSLLIVRTFLSCQLPAVFLTYVSPPPMSQELRPSPVTTLVLRETMRNCPLTAPLRFCSLLFTQSCLLMTKLDAS
jgi:hypothetical protein